jgi:predicted nucleotidyltransferase
MCSLKTLERTAEISGLSDDQWRQIYALEEQLENILAFEEIGRKEERKNGS